jgi:DNA-binding HxlR family transcriptional regulator
MLKRDYQTQVCSVARTLEVVGERWSLLIIRSVYLGVHRFEDLIDAVGITRSVLTGRLQRLVEDGVIERTPYQEHPTRYEYRLTAKGEDLWPVLVHMMRWGDTYYCEAAGAPRLLEHTGCGGSPNEHLMCDTCGELLEIGSVTPRRGPGRATGALGENDHEDARWLQSA